MEWHDPDCRRMDPVPFDNDLWTCQACGTVGPLRFFADSLGECATPEPASNQDTHKESIKRLSWPECVEYSQESFSQDIEKALCLVKANYPKVATGITYRVGEVSDAYGREILPVIYPKLAERSHIRLLELLPAPREKALEGRFQVVDIEQMPAYEALSYTWADDNNDASLCQRIFIGLGNRALPITRNCHQALSRLRRKTESFLIWVDAICINQSDLGERSDQVAMMGTIFSQAAEVHGYVGEDPDNVEGGEFGAITLLKDELQSSKLASRHFKDNAEEALGRLLRRPFFSRLWVVQEVLLARSITIHCGDSTTPISRDVFIKAKLHNAEVPWWLTEIGWIGAQSKGDMLELLSATALCKMSDMRDKIFGLLGLADDNEVNILKANYKLMVREVYIGTALYLIQQRNWHNVIELAESMTNLRLRSKYGIPSWVPMWDLQETAYNSVDLSERLGEIELGWKVRLNRDPILSSLTGNPPSQQFRTIPFLTSHEVSGNFSPIQSLKAVDAETGCLVTAGYEIAVLYYNSFMSGDENGTVDGQYRETNYHMLNSTVFLATSGPMSKFRDKPERMLGLSDILSLVKISGCRMPFLANKHVRDGGSVTYELLYPCASAIIYPIGKDHLYSNHPDFDRICTLEALYPLTLEIIKFLYHWRRMIKLRSQSPAANEFDSSSLKDEEIHAWNFFVRYSVLTGAKVSGFSGERQEWRLELEASPGWKMNRQSALVDNLMSEFTELMNFWSSEAFDAIEKLVKEQDITKTTRKIQHWHKTLGRFSASFCGRGWKGDADAQRSLTGAKLRTLKQAHEFLFNTFSQLFPTGAKKETMFLMPMDFGEISQLSEEWLGGYRDEEEAVAIMEQRWMNCTSLFSVLAESAELRGEARRLRCKIRPLGGVNIRTAINKLARQGKWEVTPVGLVGDEQQFIHHGGPEKALHQYCAGHYDVWNAELPGREDLFKIGGFGENLSATNMSETNVCIGDIFRVGTDVIIQVSGPRQPCYKLNHRFQHKKISAMTQSSGRTGWYYRVLQSGFIEQGDDIELVERINPTWPLSRVQKYLYHEKDDIEIVQELVSLPALSEEMVGIFQNRLDHGTEDMSGRLEGDRVPVVWRPYKLATKTELTPRIKSFILEAQEQNEDSEFGQFPFVRIQFGPGGNISRAYSVVSGTTNRFELGIARDDNSRGGSIYLHDSLNVGDIIKVAPGHNATATQNEKVDTNVSKHIFIIGGIGVTAFLGEIEKLSRELAEVEVGTLGGTGGAFSLSIGHIVIMMATSGSTSSSQMLGRMIVPSEPIKS
ncbi:hypothetical protein H9Q72_001024 [Fusarium xylarioides]|uniref:Heterokaryon incompatibility domain-containing protein n=1 Tax=Fusarium xylarioides TaxID=221167 RepID=A0A9P7I2L0_9HYPO|nr:hypothetical protein H9Q70_005931 [Fusarium xylarioides]KAG5772945.1 hypothetical protein H9Q72_001024 [Fusarium xylarioides]